MPDDKLNNLSLLRKYQNLLIENERLKAENKRLKAQLGIVDLSKEMRTPTATHDVKREASEESILPQPPLVPGAAINQYSYPEEKIRLYLSLFKGREEVYAKRWQNKKGGSGYAPACFNEWKPGICNKPKIKCSECPNQSFEIFGENAVEEHLRGAVVAGIYALQPDDTCYFLAIDFDDESWQKDISTLRIVCKESNIPFAIERSRSGNGAHAWFFFDEAISAVLARKFGTALLTYSMNKRHEITFKSYDRFFPSQDSMPKGGFGNLIALPLQMEARRKGNSVFIDEHFEPYPDQWKFLSNIRKWNRDEIEAAIAKLSAKENGSELGVLRRDDDENPKTTLELHPFPWEKIHKSRITKADFPDKVHLVRANMLYVLKTGISQGALNALKRLAAFKNPAFYKAQAMRLPVYNKPRIISCSDETNEYLCLPRGCEEEVKTLLNEVGVDAALEDKSNHGREIHATFKGKLRDEQRRAAIELLKFDYGVLAAATAFGKTVVAAKLIAERKTNTLVIVHRKQLLSQWRAKLAAFLEIDDFRVTEKNHDRVKKHTVIGQIGGGKENATGTIDVAIMQSLNRGDEILDRVRDYGMVIIDECHHVPAFSFEQVLKHAHAKYVYGLTATPARADGHHPIIFMQCGPVRFKVDAKSQAKQRPFDHYIIPRFTSFKVLFDKEGVAPTSGQQSPTINELYSELMVNEMRNRLIVDDVVKNHENGRNALLLTERTAHVDSLSEKIREKIPDVIALTGKAGVKENREALKSISELPPEKPLTLVATGKYIGEGFDEPRLDTLFLAMPVSWKGTLQQYVGRLHRLHEGKKEVLVYDYVDTHVKMLERMYDKRLTGYASLGYKPRGDTIAGDSANFIFNKNSFFPVYSNDLVNAQKKIVIVSPFVTKKRVKQLCQYLQRAEDNHIEVTVLTRPPEDFKDKSRSALQQAFDLLRNEKVNLLFKSNIHQKFAIIDERIVWYGSINLLSFGSAEETIMRIESSNIANELMKSMGI